MSGVRRPRPGQIQDARIGMHDDLPPRTTAIGAVGAWSDASPAGLLPPVSGGVRSVLHGRQRGRRDEAVKVIGLLGGMSWESSIVYEQILNEEARRRLGGVHSADLLIRSYDFAVVERLQAAGDWEQAGRLLADGARALEAAGAELLVLCTNTMHEVADMIAAAVAVPFLHQAHMHGHPCG